MLLYRIILLLDGSFDKDASDIVRRMVGIDGVLSLGFVVLADSLRPIHINPLHLVVSIIVIVVLDVGFACSLILFQQFRNA
jgi:hypothetical protein